MTDHHDSPGQVDDFTLRRVLREHYAAPADATYWAGLEASILDVIRKGSAAPAPGMFDFLAGWSRAGLVAAGVAGLIAGIAVTRARQTEARVAFESVFRDSSPVVAIQSAPTPEAPGAREATLRYLINP